MRKTRLESRIFINPISFIGFNLFLQGTYAGYEDVQGQKGEACEYDAVAAVHVARDDNRQGTLGPRCNNALPCPATFGLFIREFRLRGVARSTDDEMEGVVRKVTSLFQTMGTGTHYRAPRMPSAAHSLIACTCSYA